MHRAAYAELGLDWTYDAIEVIEEELEKFLRSLGEDVRGLSVTAPLKHRLAELVPAQSDDVARLGVANTVVVSDGELMLHNTDGAGATSALLERGIDHVRTVRILGAGATAASLGDAIAGMGATHVELVVRAPDRAGGTAGVIRKTGIEVVVSHVEEPLLNKVDLLISTIPGDAIGSRSHELVDAARAVFDVIYDPWPSVLDAAATECGRPIVSGLDLLAHQAALQVQLMTGSETSPQLLREAAMAELVAR